MSEDPVAVEEDVEEQEQELEASGYPKREEGSLAARMQQRQHELETLHSDVFPVPGWEEFLAVELRLVGWEALRKVVSKHDRQRSPALKELYVAADQMLLATEGFFEVSEGARDRRIEDNGNWIALARATGKELPDSLTPRQAMISLMGDTNVLVLYQDWTEWMSTRRTDLEREVAEDFGTTR